jgi:putative membrane protein
MRIFVALAILGGLGGMAGLAAWADDKKEDKEGKGKADQEFVTKASAAGLAEVNLSQLATTRSRNAAVREFAQRMVVDHGKANRELLDMANRQQLTLAKTMDDKHQKMFEKLSKLDGAEFDRTYMDGMVKDHEEAVKLFTDESKNGKNDALKEWAGKTLPTLKKHLEMANDIAKKGKDKSDTRKDDSDK